MEYTIKITLWVAYSFMTFMLDEWELCSHSIIPSLHKSPYQKPLRWLDEKVCSYAMISSLWIIRVLHKKKEKKKKRQRNKAIPGLNIIISPLMGALKHLWGSRSNLYWWPQKHKKKRKNPNPDGSSSNAPAANDVFTSKVLVILTSIFIYLCQGLGTLQLKGWKMCSIM